MNIQVNYGKVSVDCTVEEMEQQGGARALCAAIAPTITENARLKAENEQLTKDVEDWQRAHDNKARQYDNEYDQHLTLQRKFMVLQATQETLRASYAGKAKDLDLLLDENAGLKVENKVMTHNVLDWQKGYHEKEESLRAATVQIDRLLKDVKELEGYKVSCKTLKDLLDAEQKYKADLVARAVRAENEVVDNETLKYCLKNDEVEQAELRKQVQQYQKAAADMLVAYNLELERHAEMEERLANARTYYEDLQRKMDRSQETLQQSQVDASALRLNLGAHVAAAKPVKVRMELMQQEINADRDLIHQLRVSICDLQETNEAKDAHIRKLRTELNILKEQKQNGEG